MCCSLIIFPKAASFDEEEMEEELGDVGVFKTSEDSGRLELTGDGDGREGDCWWWWR